MANACFERISEEIIKHLYTARKSIQIAVCWFNNPDIFQVLLEKLTSSKVNIELIINNDAINNNPEKGTPLDFKKFITAGGRFYFGQSGKLMHNKYCILDDNTVITGSSNWTKGSANNFENVVIHEKDQRLTIQFRWNYSRIRYKSQKIIQVSDYDRLAVITENHPTNTINDESLNGRKLKCNLGIKLLNGGFKPIICKNQVIAKLGKTICFEETNLITSGDALWDKFILYTQSDDEKSVAIEYATIYLSTPKNVKDNVKSGVSILINNGHILSIQLNFEGDIVYGAKTMSIEDLFE